MSNESISTGKVATILYKLALADGEEIDASPVDEPLVYLHGNGQIIPGLEQELLGKQAGDKLKCTITPEQGYGDRSDEGLQEVPKSAFPPDVALEPGQQLTAQAEDGGLFPMRVVELKSETVVVDLNHPLAGETLHYEVEIVSVRDATEEELSHGHVHDPDGCGHDH